MREIYLTILEPDEVDDDLTDDGVRLLGDPAQRYDEESFEDAAPDHADRIGGFAADEGGE